VIGNVQTVDWSGTQADGLAFDRDLTYDGTTSPAVDLTATKFVSAHGLVSLACTLAHNRENGGVTIVHLPPDGDVVRHLSRMNFGAILDQHDCYVANWLPDVRHFDQSQQLLEIQKFRTPREIESLSNLVWDRLEGRVSPQSLNAINVGLGEIADNVRYHSESKWGFVAAQTYKLGSSGETINVAIGDIGVGIRAALARYRPKDDAHAIRLALEYEVSGIEDAGRGQGLPSTADEVTGIRGTLQIKTGTSSVLRAQSGFTDRKSIHLDGTIIGIRVPCGPGE
jgi:hypothetical protein